MQKLNTRNFFLGMGLILLLSCQTAQIPDIQFTASLGPNGASQFDLLDNKTSDLTLTQFAAYWNDLSNAKGPPVCMRSADWATLKLDLEELCSWIEGGCTEEQQQTMTSFMTHIQSP